MADYLADFYPEWVDKEENPRQVILDLGKMITNRIPVKLGFQKLNKYDPEYWGLAMLLTDEQAEVALKMGVRKPKTMEDMVKLTGKTEAELEKILGDMSFMGILEYNWENPTRTKQWVLPMFVPGSAEFTNMNDTILKKYPEMGRFFERMSRLPLEKVTPMVPPGGAGIGMHVIPVEKAIETENQSISVEHISHWLDKHEGKYAASPCSCRKSRLTFDEGCADDPEGWCVAVGDMADYVVETGKGGRYITKEEALEIFRKGEENGFVHQITNIDGADKIFAICNCNINVCYALRTSQLFNTPNLSRSAYVARVETDDCVACGKCVEVCPAGAVKLGQKLCTKDGKQVEYPKMPLPSEQKWGPHMWDENYRDNNRINCYDTGTAPCKTACPAHIAVQGYLKMAAQGRYTYHRPTVLCIHGNHEMRPWEVEGYHLIDWMGGKVWVQDKHPKLLFAKDGEVYTIDGLRIMPIGGAYSVDKFYRISRGAGWWESEQPTEEIKSFVEKQLSENEVDIIISHTCPLKYEPIEVFLPGIDQSKVDKSTEEWLGKIEATYHYKAWFCGHFHIDKHIDKMHFMYRTWETIEKEQFYNEN